MIRHNEVILLNEIIKATYGIQDYDCMRESFLERLGALIPYQQSSFYLASIQKEHILDKPVGVGISKQELYRYIEKYEDKDYTRWIFMSGKTIVYRETDLIPDQVRSQSEYYQEVYVPSKMYYSAQMSIAYKEEFLGVISLYRNKEQGDFSDEEMFFLELLKDHIEYRVGHERQKVRDMGADSDNKTKFDAYQFVEKYGLTVREVEILGLLMGGMESKIICETLSISPNTLKKHANNIYRKLNIGNRWELIQYVK